MMRAALIGDVHANLPALEAVLADARRRGAEAVWNVGDGVGYNAFPDEVVRLLGAVGAVSIAGNYDLKVLKVPRKAAQWRRKKRPEKWLAFKWAYEHLSEESRAYLAALPREVRLTVEGRRVLLTHGSPGSIDEPLSPESPVERLGELARLARADVVACGHSHQPFAHQVDGVWFINPGSVGRMDDGDPRASYAILDIRRDLLEPHLLRIAYDVERAAAAIRRHRLPRAFAEMIRRGKSLDAIAPEDGGMDENPCGDND
ncbi:MAG: metallophosphoesterase family protein [bacterium]|nr:metallophosphoesterase family protein [bacterium]